MAKLRVRALTVLGMGAVVLASTGAAQAAAAPARTAVHLHAAAASFRAGLPVVMSGSVSPKSLKQVTLERLVGKAWVVIGHAKPSATGTFTLSVKGAKEPAVWRLRAVRAKSAVARQGISAMLTVRVVRTGFTFTGATATSVTSDAPIVVTGKVAPKATGTVWMQALSGTVWHNVASAKLGAASTFSLSSHQPVGVHKLRVVKAATTKIAAGMTKTLSVTVTLPAGPVRPVGPVAPVAPAPLTVTTTSLPEGTVGLDYRAQLAAAGGVPPYLWSVPTGSLPAGLSVSAAGAVSGVGSLAVSVTVPVAVADAAGHAASATIGLRLTLSPAATNGVLGWGNGTGLGNGSTSSSNVPVPVSSVLGVISVVGGDSATYALRFDGTVWAWGDNTWSELGSGNGNQTTLPVPVIGLTDVVALAAGGDNGYAVKADGTAWAWGDNTSSQLGVGTIGGASNTPVQVHNLTGVKSIAGNSDGAYALETDGTVWAWGSDKYGHLGDGLTATRSVPVQVPGLTGVTAIAGGIDSGFALKSDGTVWSWGSQYQGNLGNGVTTGDSSNGTPTQMPNLTRVTAIVDGRDGTGYALESDGTVWAWGAGALGQIGNALSSDAAEPVQVATLAGVIAIAAGNTDGYALETDGTVWAWGANDHDQLGHASGGAVNSPLQVSGVTHAVSIGAGGLNGYAVSPG